MDIRKETLAIARNLMKKDPSLTDWIVSKFPELKESEDESIRKELIRFVKGYFPNETSEQRKAYLTWLEKQGEKGAVLRDTFGYEEGRQRGREEGIMLVLDNPRKYGLEKQGEQKPNYCHHEVDLSGCSEEYRKAYYDGWNNCNQQHAQLKAEQNPAWSEEDYNEIETIACHLDNIDNEGMAEALRNIRDKYCHFIPQSAWKPSEEQINALQESIGIVGELTPRGECLKELVVQLKKLRGEE